jgi:hypothetical protein
LEKLAALAAVAMALGGAEASAAPMTADRAERAVRKFVKRHGAEPLFVYCHRAAPTRFHCGLRVRSRGKTCTATAVVEKRPRGWRTTAVGLGCRSQAGAGGARAGAPALCSDL